jgi:excinuclease ABC subunit B
LHIRRETLHPAGDQPQAIAKLTAGLLSDTKHQVLLGVTGSGKTFTVANVIAQVQRPTLVLSHNKTLAAQLASEFKDFFPDSAVNYFVSYYDYYQPEAYLPRSDTYIEKETQINEEIDRLRNAATRDLLTRRDVIIVASVSCIYGLGSPVEYEKVNMRIERGAKASRNEFIRKLIDIHYDRTTADLESGTFRAVGNSIEIMPVSDRVIYRIELSQDKIEAITKIDAITRAIIEDVESFFLFPALLFCIKAQHHLKKISRYHWIILELHYQ